MTRSIAVTVAFLALSAASLAAGPGVEQILEKNASARGGLAAWRAVNTLTFEGKMDAGGKPNHELPFVLRQKRPHKSRLEIQFRDQTAVQVFDGTQGWKIRPFLNRNEVESLTAQETRQAASADDLDGPLLDHAAKGNQVLLLGTESVAGRPAYKLRVSQRDGAQRTVWVDAQSYLEVKVSGEPRKLDGHLHNVAILLRDYRPEGGLTIAREQETVVEGVKQSYKMSIARVSVNEPMADTLFQKPTIVTPVKDAAKATPTPAAATPPATKSGTAARGAAVPAPRAPAAASPQHP